MGSIKKICVTAGIIIGMAGGWLGYGEYLAKKEKPYIECNIDKFQKETVPIINKAMYTVPVAHKGVILGMGGLWERVQDPGLNFRLPFEKVYVVNVNKIRKLERGFRTEERGVESTYSEEDFSDESLMVSGDEGELEVQYSVQFKIKDPIKYLFAVKNPIETLSQATESSVREIIAKRGYNDALTVGKEQIGLRATETAKKILDDYNTGIDLMAILLQPIKPPTPEVQEAFDKIHMARQDAESIIQRAEQEKEKAVRKTRGEKVKIIESAKGQASKMTNEAEGEVEGYLELYEGYKTAPGPNRKRMHLETIEELLGNSDLTIIDKDVKGLLPHLNVNEGGEKK